MTWTMDAEAAAQLERSWRVLVAGGNAKWFLEDLNYLVPEELQRQVEAAIAADHGTRNYFEHACDWTELAKGADDPFTFLVETLARHGVAIAIERPAPAPAPAPPPPAAVPPTPAIANTVGVELVVVDGWEPDRECAAPPDATPCALRPAESLDRARMRAWIAAARAAGPITGLDLRRAVDRDDALVAEVIATHPLRVLLLPFIAGLGPLVEGAPTLSQLEILGIPDLDDVDEATLAAFVVAIGEAPALTTLDCRELATPIPAAALEALCSLSKLTALRAPPLTDYAAGSLGRLAALHTLDLATTEDECLGAAVFEALAALPALERLRLPRELTAEAVEAIAKLDVTTLDARPAYGTELDAIGLLATMPRLATLQLPEHVEPDTLARLAALPALTTLDLSDVGLAEEVIPVLAQFASLRRLRMGSYPELAEAIRQALPAVVVDTADAG